MKLFGALRFYAAFEEVRTRIQDLDELPVGDAQKVYIPESETMGALLVKGKSGTRFRIQGVVVKRER